jgi:hypothetical protein
MKTVIFCVFFFCYMFELSAQSTSFTQSNRKQIINLLNQTKVHLNVWVNESGESNEKREAKVFFDSLGVRLKISCKDLKEQIARSNHNGVTEILHAFKTGKIDINEAQNRIRYFSCVRELEVEKLIRELDVLYSNVINTVNSLDSAEKYDDSVIFLLSIDFLENDLPEASEKIKNILESI